MKDHELQTSSPPDSGSEYETNWIDEAKEENGGSKIEESVRIPLMSPSIKLALSVQSDSTDEIFDRSATVNEHTDCSLTPIQTLELQVQTRIYKQLATGLPLPHHLVIPHWTNVATYLASTSSSTYHHYQNCIEFGSKGLNFKYMVDPEPGRCRRTDGKKWRCRKNSLPQQKYCEGHIHRGRQSSRKPVEVSEINSPSVITTPHNSDISLKISLTASYREKESKSWPFLTPVKLITTSIATENTSIPCPAKVQGETNGTVSAIKNHEDCCDNGGRDFHVNNLGNSRKNYEKVQNTVALGLGFSPNSVLQVLGSSGSKKGVIDIESGRCRRTDGKKWRCSRDVIPDQKYCGIHMHRGSIKKFKSYQYVDSSSPNTNLSISIRPSSKPKGNEEKDRSSNGSETTISNPTLL